MVPIKTNQEKQLWNMRGVIVTAGDFGRNRCCFWDTLTTTQCYVDQQQPVLPSGLTTESWNLDPRLPLSAKCSWLLFQLVGHFQAVFNTVLRADHKSMMQFMVLVIIKKYIYLFVSNRPLNSANFI